ncbi:MAG: SPFH domain-containing protein, partial [Bifidobacteriaceae bacterium]|nr:SPFH domain-containing protein [Bifidobacteriaceae bacterium]
MWLIILAILVIAVFAAGIYIVPQQSIAVVERLGKFLKVSDAGIHIRIPFIDVIKGRVTLRVSQLDNIIQTKTKDNVFVQAKISV